MNIKTKALLLLVGLAFANCRRHQNKIKKYYENGNIGLVIDYPDENDSLSCNIFVYYRSGMLFKQATMFHGKYVGKKITYYENGKISQVDSLLMPCDTSVSNCDGILKRYYENGNIAQQYIIRNKQSIKTRQYDNNGILVKEYSLKNDSLKDGLYKEFYPNGRASFSATFKDNIISGFSYYFDQNGDTIKYYNNTDGIISFPYKKWLENGQTIQGDFTDTTQKAVLWIWQDEKGKELKRKISHSSKNGFITPNK